jgi:hypothetical protein
VGLGIGITLLGGLSEPVDRLPGILHDTLAGGIADTEVVLGIGIALFGHSLSRG